MNKMKVVMAGSALGAVLAVLPAIGQAEEKSGGPTFADVLANSGVSIRGYIDVSYTDLNTDGVFVSGVPSRVFDTEPDSFNLHQAAIFISKQPVEGWGGLVNLTLGDDADVVDGVDPSLNKTGTLFDDDSISVTQAFLQYASGPWTLMVGKYVTASGMEVIDSTGVSNLSRSILFGYAIPFTHTGFRVSYKFSDAFTILGGVNNGWDLVKDQDIFGNNLSGKTLELGVMFKPIEPLFISLVGYSGDESVFVGPLTTDIEEEKRTLIDLVVNWTVTDQLTLGLNYDDATQDIPAALGGGDVAWDGIAGYANYKIDDQWRVSLRGESFDDKDGARTGLVQEWKETTLTVGYASSANLEILGEVRKDTSDFEFLGLDAFVTDDGTDTQDDQTSVALKAIYKF